MRKTIGFHDQKRDETYKSGTYRLSRAMLQTFETVRKASKAISLGTCGLSNAKNDNSKRKEVNKAKRFEDEETSR